MKNKIFKTLEHKLQWLVLLVALHGVSQSVWGWTIESGKKIYYIDIDDWGSAYIHYWGSNSGDLTCTKISGTKIFYYTGNSNLDNLGGFKFRASTDNWDKQGAGNIECSVSQNVWFDQKSTVSSGSIQTANTTMSNINGTAYLKCKINSNNGSGYVDGSNANCVATVSGKTVSSGATSTSNVSSSTGSGKQSVSISPAYGSTVEYTGTNGTGYTYMGSSSTGSTSLPADKQTSKRSVTSNEYNGGSITYYAYFKLNQYTVKATVGDVAGGTVQVTGGSSSSTSSTATGVNHGSEVTFTATPNDGYRFVEWNTASDGSGTQKSTDATYEDVQITSATEYFAIFEPACASTISGVTTAYNYELIELTTSGSSNWTVVTVPSGGSGYIVSGASSSTTFKYKGTAGNDTTGKDFVFRATATDDSCYDEHTVTIKKDSETCP